MRTSEMRASLEDLEAAPAPDPSPVFVAKLEADLRAMDQVDRAAHSPRARGRRLLVAAAPVAALATAAAAAALTLLPGNPHPRQVSTADPGVTAPARPPDAPTSSAPTPTTTVVAPPWLPTSPAPTPTTTAAPHAKATVPAPAPGEHATPSVVPPREPVATTVPHATTTTPAPETLSLHCTPGMSAGNPVVFCGWSQSTSPAFKWYHLWREAQGSSLAVVFQSDNVSTTGYYDKAVQSATNYYYEVDVTDAAGNVIGSSNIVAISCC